MVHSKWYFIRPPMPGSRTVMLVSAHAHSLTHSLTHSQTRMIKCNHHQISTCQNGALSIDHSYISTVFSFHGRVTVCKLSVRLTSGSHEAQFLFDLARDVHTRRTSKA
uniref:Uncharacterized protein n=1 Tax=Craspedostauros australis TaxID=1486917 RepID=A0A7R9WQN0_9STRA|mmetsp:Transcript_16088/g.44561  ORF Transcript_16088/g.44561 Transcript_16088/m.44561 type:complete len:108 (+) Transcript_16088:590-913(+)